MGPVVAVEIIPQRPAEGREQRALLKACSQALPAGACESLGSVSGEPAASARVSWDDTGNAAVTIRLEGDERELTRMLDFEPGDARVQRWRSVGLAIATMVDELKARRDEATDNSAPRNQSETEIAGDPAPSSEPAHVNAQEPAAATRKPPTPITRAQAHGSGGSAARPPSATAAEAGIGGGTGLSGGARGGVYARLAYDMNGVPAYMFARAAYELSAGQQPSTSWVALGVGGGVYFRWSRLRFELSAGPDMVRTGAAARSPINATVDRRSVWLPGVSATTCVVFYPNGPVSPLVGALAGTLAREVVITNAGREVGRAPAYRVGLFFGVRFAP